jgi:hypothetical protein
MVSMERYDDFYELLVLWVGEKLTLRPPPPTPCSGGRVRRGIIIFDVLNSLLNHIQIFFKDITTHIIQQTQII